MSHIVKFRIEGLAGRGEIYEKELNRDINIFFGLNGAGKTSLLRILHSAMSGNANLLANVPFKWAEVEIHSVKYKGNFVRRCEKIDVEVKKISKRGIRKIKAGDIDVVMYDENIENKSDMSWKCYPSNDKRIEGAHWMHVFLPTDRMFSGYEDKRSISRKYAIGIEESELYWDVIFANQLESLWSSYSGELIREVRKIQDDGLERILRNILSPGRKVLSAENIDAGTAYDRVKSFFSRRSSSRGIGSVKEFCENFNESPQLRSVVIDVDAIEKQIEAAMASRDLLQALIEKMFTGKKNVLLKDNVLFVETKDNKEIQLSSLSSGEKNVLLILIQSLMARENSIIIDEPEISLHIDWQRELIQSMNMLNPRAQFIISTHSPEIMANIPDSKIFKL